MGKRTLFLVTCLGAGGASDIYSMAADGSDPIRLTDNPAWDGWGSYLPSPKE